MGSQATDQMSANWEAAMEKRLGVDESEGEAGEFGTCPGCDTGLLFIYNMRRTPDADDELYPATCPNCDTALIGDCPEWALSRAVEIPDEEC